jgi:hypothetical protein
VSPAFWVQTLRNALSESRVPQLARLCALGNVPLVAMCAAVDLLAAPFVGTSNQRLVARRPGDAGGTRPLGRRWTR